MVAAAATKDGGGRHEGRRVVAVDASLVTYCSIGLFEYVNWDFTSLTHFLVGICYQPYHVTIDANHAVFSLHRKLCDIRPTS